SAAAEPPTRTAPGTSSCNRAAFSRTSCSEGSIGMNVIRYDKADFPAPRRYCEPHAPCPTLVGVDRDLRSDVHAARGPDDRAGGATAHPERSARELHEPAVG